MKWKQVPYEYFEKNPPNLNFFFVSFIILESNRWYMLNKWSIFKEKSSISVWPREDFAV